MGEELAPYLPYVERADRRIDRLVELIGDLLSLSRIDLERASSAPAVADVGMAVSAIVDLYRPQIGKRKLAASVSVATGLGRVRMGEDDLRTVLGNLVGNAIKYGRPGGSLTVTARADAGKIVIEVADSGIGIRPESLPRLFEEFFREKRSETRDIEGNGLGLAIVKRTVERVGGSVEVESVLGEGTTFRLRLPAA